MNKSPYFLYNNEIDFEKITNAENESYIHAYSLINNKAYFRLSDVEKYYDL